MFLNYSEYTVNTIRKVQPPAFFTALLVNVQELSFGMIGLAT